MSPRVVTPVMPHREIPIQVTAWVDEGVADLVVALNAVPGVLTLDSCQEEPDGHARVTFCTYDRALLRETVTQLGAIIDGQGWHGQVKLALGPGCDDDPPVADLTCRPPLVAAVARELRANASRKTESRRGRFGREPRNWRVRRSLPATARGHGDTGRSPGSRS